MMWLRNALNGRSAAQDHVVSPLYSCLTGHSGLFQACRIFIPFQDMSKLAGSLSPKGDAAIFGSIPMVSKHVQTTPKKGLKEETSLALQVTPPESRSKQGRCPSAQFGGLLAQLLWAVCRYEIHQLAIPIFFFFFLLGFFRLSKRHHFSACFAFVP